MTLKVNQLFIILSKVSAAIFFTPPQNYTHPGPCWPARQQLLDERSKPEGGGFKKSPCPRS